MRHRLLESLRKAAERSPVSETIEAIRRLAEPSPVSKTLEALQRAAERSPVSETMEALQRAAERSPISETMEALRRAAERSPVSETLEALRRAAERSPISETMETMRRLAEPSPISETLEAMRRGAFVNLRDLRNFASELAQAQSSLEGLIGTRINARLEVERLAFVSTSLATGVTLPSVLVDLGKRQEENRASGISPIAAATAAERPVLESLSTLKLSPENARLFIELLFGLFLFWVAQRASEESEARIVQRLEGLQKEIATALNMRSARADQREPALGIVVVKRPVTVLSRPSGRQGHYVGKLHPYQHALLLGRRGKWVRVEALDVAKNQLIRGWVMNKYVEAVR